METFSPKLDKTSENLIYLLSINSRQTISSLAKELALPRKIIENRTKNLYQKGFIKPLLVTNEASRIRFTVLVKLSRIDNQIIGKIKNLSGLLKLKETLGQYDLSILFDVYSREEADKTIANISKLCHNRIITFDVLFHGFEDTMGYKSFCHNPQFLIAYNRLEPKSATISSPKTEVLNILKKQPNISFVSLSKKTGMGYLKLKEFIDSLASNQIVRFSIDPDYNRLGLEFHNIFVKVNMGKKKEFENYILKHPRIHWIKHCSGRWDYALSIAAKNISEFIDISRQIRTENKNNLLEETSLVSKIQETRRY